MRSRYSRGRLPAGAALRCSGRLSVIMKLGRTPNTCLLCYSIRQSSFAVKKTAAQSLTAVPAVWLESVTGVQSEGRTSERGPEKPGRPEASQSEDGRARREQTARSKQGAEVEKKKKGRRTKRRLIGSIDGVYTLGGPGAA